MDDGQRQVSCTKSGTVTLGLGESVHADFCSCELTQVFRFQNGFAHTVGDVVDQTTALEILNTLQADTGFTNNGFIVLFPLHETQGGIRNHLRHHLTTLIDGHVAAAIVCDPGTQGMDVHAVPNKTLSHAPRPSYALTVHGQGINSNSICHLIFLLVLE